jgi:hypothetical protein
VDVKKNLQARSLDFRVSATQRTSWKKPQVYLQVAIELKVGK